MNKRADFSTGLEASAFWMPYTANRQFKKSPRLLVRAEGMHYWTAEDRRRDPEAGGGDGLRADVQHGAPDRVRVRRAPGRHRARALLASVLHQLRIRVRRY